MNTMQCDYLDDYLSGALSDRAAVRFEAHLADCAACRERLRRQRQIDRLLVQAVGRLEPVPAGLLERIEHRTRPSLRRRAAWLAGSLATAAAALTLGVWLAAEHVDGFQEQEPAVPQRALLVADQKPPAPPPAPDPVVKSEVRVAVKDPSSAILVSQETKAPNVSIVFVYPTVRPSEASKRPVTK